MADEVYEKFHIFNFEKHVKIIFGFYHFEYSLENKIWGFSSIGTQYSKNMTILYTGSKNLFTIMYFIKY